jgi:hypothetical protein
VQRLFNVCNGWKADWRLRAPDAAKAAIQAGMDLTPANDPLRTFEFRVTSLGVTLRATFLLALMFGSCAEAPQHLPGCWKNTDL